MITPVLALDLPADRDSVKAARSEVRAFATAQGLSGRRLDDVTRAVSEAASNVVMHAYEAGESGHMTVAARVEGRMLEIVVADEGHGLRAGASDGLGVGLSVMASSCDDFSIAARQPRGLEVRLRFALA